ncbi:AzlC family ABC transporter permease [Gordonia soli]|uniref:AzlC family protein n=1 Tax=Gordonia soli NBRC 108243 TaxID=1223545 RepID=M0QJ64_9ACTN|nr:AzlC family ABC transporter permease [Gordonia soli]GAC68670.1 AzlC family protein [Gordonia soli NBRC 108243]
MRSVWRTLDRQTIRSIVLLSVSVLVIGASYGVAAHGAGLIWWQILLLATVVLAGSSEFVFVGVLAAGGAPILGAIAGLLVNTRNLGYGLAIGPLLERGPALLFGSHFINDETAVVTTGVDDRRVARAAFFLCGVGILVCWPVGAVAGSLIGNAVSDPAVLGLDAAFPALLGALALPALRDGSTWTAAAIGGAAALAATPFLPAGLPILLALIGVPLVEVARRARRRRSGAGPECSAEPSDTAGADEFAAATSAARGR